MSKRKRNKFTLEIDLGNDAMQTPGDIGRLLVKIGNRFRDDQDGPDVRDSGKLMDENGNSVGTWEVFTESPARRDDDPMQLLGTAVFPDLR